MPENTTIVLWLVLERLYRELKYMPSIRIIRNTDAKNRLIKKVIRLQSLKPLIYTNYRKN